MKLFTSSKLVFALLAGLLLAGCATHSTVPSRKKERAAAYAALPPDLQTVVDSGNVKRGMDTNAVYIAWGQPGQVNSGETDAGQTMTWSYYGFYMQQATVWGAHHVYYNSYPVNYISAQVIFTNGLVKQWQTYPAPGY
jgi:hypothetical protein